MLDLSSEVRMFVNWSRHVNKLAYFFLIRHWCPALKAGSLSLYFFTLLPVPFQGYLCCPSHSDLLGSLHNLSLSFLRSGRLRTSLQNGARPVVGRAVRMPSPSFYCMRLKPTHAACPISNPPCVAQVSATENPCWAGSRNRVEINV